MREAKRSRCFKRCAILVFFSAVLLGCGGGGGGGGGGEKNLGNTTPSGTVGEPGLPAGGCTNVLDGDVRTQTHLVDTGAACDYSLQGLVIVSSMLTIDPGVVIVAEKNALLSVEEGGEIHALGTPDKHIVLESSNHAAGDWTGIHFFNARESEFDNVDIRDAGQECYYFLCPEAALLVDGTVVSFTNSSISNSASWGLVLFTKARLNRFSNNQFFGNVNAGIQVDIEQVPSLDEESDYGGEQQPNGTPYVLVAGEQVDGATFRWKKLKAPYIVPQQIKISGGFTILEPGVEVLFGSQAVLQVEGNGELRARGTPEQPITFRGKVEQAGFWTGISFYESWSDRNEFSYVKIENAGEDQSLIAQNSAIHMHASMLGLNNATISNNNGWPVICDPGNWTFWPDSKITLGTGMQILQNTVDSIDEDCVIANAP